MSYVRTVIASVRVGWSREFGWTHPLIGISLKTIGPIASTMTAATVLYIGFKNGNAISTAQLPYLLGYILLGATLYAHVSAYSWVPTLAIAEGKWTYVFPQVYVSPKSSPPYLAGRCLGSFATSIVTSMISLVVAVLATSVLFDAAVPFVVSPISIVLFSLALIVNFLASMGLGFLLGAYAIFASKFEWALPTYVSGLLMVFSEALFPVSLLPHPFSDVGNVLPFTWFIRASRAALLPGINSPPYFDSLFYSLVGGLVLLGIGLIIFKGAEKRARQTGVLDRKVV
ncbi:MAG TPA: ABC transporter permease [Candidatus Dormibacteraeota bacterium]|jgi:ABC-2 type transport system permease protein|nr:ABC transporter permease [Candidatus Dormibacteraeota bacterium]